MTAGLAIEESYGDWAPPFDPKPIITRLLDSVPGEYLSGIDTVILASSGALNRKRRRQTQRLHGRKFANSTARGLYHPRWHGQGAYVELFVDNILRSVPSPRLSRLPVFGDLEFGDVLYHEIGHHIHAVKHPEHEDRELVAERWRKRLIRRHMRHRFWYLQPLRLLLWPLSLLMNAIVYRHRRSVK